MKRLKEDILKNQLSTSSSTDNSTPSTFSSTDNSTLWLSDTYILGVGIVALLAIFVFFAYNIKFLQTSNKEQAKEKQQPVEPRH